MDQPLTFSICAMSLVVSLTTVGACDDGKLNESTAREVIGQPGPFMGENGEIGTVWLNLVNSPFWKNGEAARLTINKCWVVGATSKSEEFASGGEIAPHCPDIASAELFSRDGSNWYAQKVQLRTYRPKIDQIVEILTRDDEAKATYTIGWSETELFKNWRNAEPAYFSELTQRPPPPAQRTACLRKYDQGWRLCE